jgi:hypothetical protein
MAFKRLDRARVNSTTSGTGTLTLGSALAAFQTFTDAGLETGDEVAYLIEEGAAWEYGTGVYNETGPTLTRNLEDSSTGSLLNLSGAGAFVTAIVRASDFDQAFVVDSRVYIADGTSTLTLDSAPTGTLVLFDGIAQTAWTRSGKTVTWVGVPPALGNKILALAFGATALQHGVTRRKGVLTPSSAVAGATASLPFAPANNDALDIYWGGVLLDNDDSDYTISGSTVTFLFDTLGQPIRYTIVNPLGIAVPAADVIDETMIKTSAVSAILTKLWGLTTVAGDLLYATGAGVLARLAKGTAGQKLRMNAAGTAPEWESGWELIETVNITSSVASYTRNDLSAYNQIRIEGNIRLSVATNILLRLSEDNGATLVTATSYSRQTFYGNGASAIASFGSSNSGFTDYSTQIDANSGGAIIEYLLTNFNQAKRTKCFMMQTQENQMGFMAGTLARNIANDGIGIIPASGNIAEAQLFVWGKRG